MRIITRERAAPRHDFFHEKPKFSKGSLSRKRIMPTGKTAKRKNDSQNDSPRVAWGKIRLTAMISAAEKAISNSRRVNFILFFSSKSIRIFFSKAKPQDARLHNNRQRLRKMEYFCFLFVHPDPDKLDRRGRKNIEQKHTQVSTEAS